MKESRDLVRRDTGAEGNRHGSVRGRIGHISQSACERLRALDADNVAESEGLRRDLHDQFAAFEIFAVRVGNFGV